MPICRQWVRVLLVAIAGLLAATLISCSTFEGPAVVAPAIPGASFVGNKVCAECHNYVRVFPSSAHGRIQVESAKLLGVSGCEACHGPGSLHVAGGGGRGKYILNPGKDPTSCLACHLQTEAEFHLPQRHPVLESKMNCVQCHDPHGLDIFKPAGGLAMARFNQVCAQCHREQTRPVTFEHEAMREGCTVCHQPHGSFNAKLLVQPDLNLCLRCHAQVQGPNVQPGQLVIGIVNHTLFVSRGACWSSGCHTAIHGSNINPHFLY